jgi:6-phosphogluconolactonase (cycloisomerase 2 family)
MRATSRWVLILSVLLAVALSSCENATNNHGAGTVWVATQGDQKLTSFSINLTSGALSQVGNQVSTGVTPAGMAITPDQRTVFLVNSGDSMIGVYGVNSDGSLQASSCSSCTAGQNPVALAVDPTGKLLFVANQGTFSNPASGTVSVFSISSGSPSPVTTFATGTMANTTGTGPSGIIVSPVSFSCASSTGPQTCYAIYVSNQFTNTVSAFQYFVDSSGTFNVQPTGGSPYTAGTNPTGLAFSRCAGISSATAHCPTNDDNNLFVSNFGSGNVTIFTACIQLVGSCTTADGSLLPSSGLSTAGIGPVAVVVNPVIDFVYTVDQRANQVSQFSYSPVTGTLTALSPAAVSTASNPAGGGITRDGSVLIVPNNGTSNMSIYKVNLPPPSGGASTSTGKLVPGSQPTVSLTGQPSAVLVR